MYVVLEALDGPSVGARTNVAAGQTVRIGREAGNDFVVPQDPTLSRTHFHLTYDGAGCVVKNQSRYGTFVNNRRVDDEDVVNDGDEVRAGVCRFSVRFIHSDDSIRKSTSPEMPVVADEAAYAPRSNHRGGGSLPPVAEDDPVQEPGRARGAPAIYGLPPIEEEEPLAEPGTGFGRRDPARTGHGHAPAAGAAAAAEPKTDHLRVRVDEHGLRVEPLADVLGRVRLGDQAKSAAGGATTLKGLIDALAGLGLVTDSLKVLAAALPPQAAVRWACRCVRESGAATEQDEPALAAAERWAADPSEKHRRDAQAAAEQLEYGTAAAWAAVAAFWSGGSMGPPNVPVVPPPPDLMPQALHGAVSLAAVAKAPEKADEMHRRFLTFGLNGGATGAV